MEPPPSSSSVPNFSQQNTTRNGGSTQSSPNPARPLSPTSMRQKVVEILAATANGCLQELGYYPGMSARLQELESRNKNWQSENVKLYEDNKRLVENMKIHHEGLRLLPAPETEKIKRISSLEVENRALKTQLDQLMKIKSPTDLVQIARYEQNYDKLHKEYMALTETYNRAYNEIVRLRQIMSGGQGLNPLQHQDQMAYQAFQQNALRTTQNARQVAPQNMAHVQVQAQHVPSQHMLTVHSSAGINQNVAGQQQLLRNEVAMLQNDIAQRQYAQSSSARRMSGSMTGSMNPPIQIQPPPYHNAPPHQQVHGQLATSPIANLPPQYQFVPSMHNSRLNQTPSMGPTCNTLGDVRRASNPIIPSNPHVISHTSQPTHQYVPSNNPPNSTMRVGSAPLPNQNSGAGPLLPNPTALNRSIPPNNPYPVAMMQNSEPQIPRPQSNGLHVSRPTNIPPNATLMNPPPALVAPTPTFPANVPAMISQPTDFSPSNTPTIKLSMQRNEFSSNPAYAPPNTSRPNSGTSQRNAASPISHSRTMNLKRESMSMDSEWSNESNKKPRMESPMDDQNTPPPSPSVPPSTAGREVSMEVTIPETEIKPIPPVEQAAEDDDEEEEVVEVGPDGLRLVDDILEQVYGENRSEEVVCWFCKHRYDNKYTDIPPAPFVGATDRELEQHCIKEHLDAWNQARADV